MTPPFPNSPTPAYYRQFRWTNVADKRNGVHYVGDTVTLTLTSALSVDVTYEVRDYFGTILSSGSVNSGNTSFTPTVPAGGWQPGWYRVYLSQSTDDANFAFSAGATNFCVVRNDSHFVAMPAGNTVGGHLSESPDMVAKGVMGIGTTRLQIDDAANYTVGTNNLANCELDLALTNTYWVAPGAPYADSNRPRYAWCQFPNGGVDMLLLGSTAGWFMCATQAIDGAQVFVQVSAGSISGWKVQVYFPDAVTLVETFDNIAEGGDQAGNFPAAINGNSAYVVFYAYNGTFSATGPTAIGHDYFSGVSDVVADLYPLGCTHFEGPINEPWASGVTAGMVAHMMLLFQAAVHDGNAAAKAIGPCYVSIDWSGTQGWYDFVSHGGADYCDELSTHAYNSQTNGDTNLGRTSWETFLSLLHSFGISKTIWQTESTHVFTPVDGIYHPRRARVSILQTLLMEQYGISKERNNWWYDVSHGFWSYPSWFENGDGSLNPDAVLFRVLAEETWGKPFSSALDFGTPGNDILIGNVYAGSSGNTVVMMSTSFMEDLSVTLAVTGASLVTLVDGFGVATSVALSQGRMQVQMTDIPAYLQLPAGASAGVYQINDWPPLTGPGGSFSSAGTTKEIDGVSYPVIANDGFMTNYSGGTGIAPTTYATPPSVSRVLFPSSRTVERVIVWCGPVWQSSGTLLTFDVQTTTDGSNWTTRRTITKPTPDYFEFGTTSTNVGCFLETYWDEQWVFDVKLPSPVSCTGVRLNVTAASYGGEPLSDTTYGSAFGQGNSVQGYRIEEIGIYGFVSSAGRPGRRRGKGSAW